jgi:hypothetical protein
VDTQAPVVLTVGQLFAFAWARRILPQVRVHLVLVTASFLGVLLLIR